MNTATYEVWVRSPTSPYLRKCLIDDYKRLQFRPVVNNYAGLSIIIHQDSTHLQYIDYLDRIEVVRKILNPLTGITEQQTFGHIVLSKERNLGEDGKGSEYMTIQAMSYNVLLNSRIILPPSVAESSGSFTMTAVSGATGFTINGLLNPGFETAGAGGADIWANWTETAGDGALANEATLFHSGAKAAKMTAGATANTKVSQDVTVIGGNRYLLTFWTRGNSATAGRYEIYDATNSADIVAIKTTGVTGEIYTRVTETFFAPAACTSARIILQCPPTNTNIAYFDDITLTPVIYNGDKITPNDLTNPGFETAGAGGADIWTGWTETAGDGTLTNEGTIVHSGSKAARLTAGATANTLIQQNIAVVGGASCLFTFWARGDGTNSGRYRIIDVTNSTDIIATTTTGVTGTSYTQVATTFSIPTACTLVGIVFRCPTANGGIAYIDDVALIPTANAQVRVSNATNTTETVNVTAAFTAAVSAETFTILRAHSTYSKLTDNLMKQYVRDCLTTATDTSRDLAGFSVAADTSAAPDTLVWSVRYLRLLDQLTQISDAGGVDFDVVTKTDNTLEFKTYYPQLGTDRQVGNTSGNAPCVFAVERDNIKNQRWWNSALQMTDQGGNYIYVAGAGDGAGRAVVQRLSPASVTQFSRWEKFVDARDAQTDAELADRADAKINELSKLDTGARFEALASDGNIWGVHYNLGDLVTVRIWNENATLNDKISAIDVMVDENGIETVLPIVGSELPHFGMRFTRLRKATENIMTAD